MNMCTSKITKISMNNIKKWKDEDTKKRYFTEHKSARQQKVR